MTHEQGNSIGAKVQWVVRGEDVRQHVIRCGFGSNVLCTPSEASHGEKIK